MGKPLLLGDGRLLVTVTRHESEETSVELWRVDPANGDSHRFATDARSPTISTDGRSLAFLRSVDGWPQAHVQSLEGGEARAVSQLPLGAKGARWLPDGRILALATLWKAHPDLAATADHEPDDGMSARATEDAVYRYWDEWIDHVHHPVLLDPEGGDPLDLTPGSTRFWLWPATHDPMDDIDVAPDGRLIAFCADDSPTPHRELSWSLFTVATDGSDLKRLDDDRPGHSHRPRFDPDGGSLIYGYQEEADYYASPTRLIRRHLADASEETLATDWDRSPDDWVLQSDGSIILVAEDRGRSRLWRSTGAEPVGITHEGWATHPAVAPDGSVYYLGQSLSDPPEIHCVSADDASRQITDFTAEAAEQVEAGAVREISFAGGDSDTVQMWLVDPPGADPEMPLPLVHLIHGGPHGTFGDTWHWRWNAQVVAAAGYRVAMVNFHGSTGWGDDFTRSIHGAWGDLPQRDIEAATDHLLNEGLAEPDRIAITGGSYGGYLAAWITSQTDRYACAIAHAAVTDLTAMYASDITYGRARAYGSELWEDRAAIDRWSPQAHADGYRTPTLVIHGEQDARVPVTQGLELYGVLVSKGVPARLVSYPDENHWVLSRANSIHWYGEFLDWLERWL